MKIRGFKTHNLRNDAHFQYHTEFRDLVVAQGVEVLKIKPQFETYLLLYDRVDEAFKKIVKSELTVKIHEADKARDEIWAGMLDMNNAALKHFNPEMREAAARLKIVFDAYGNVAVKPLNEGTSVINSLLQEFQGKYAQEVSIVGIENWVSELRSRNSVFEALVKERFDEAASKSGIVLKKARAELDVVYRSIIERVNALIVVEGVEAYEVFARTLNVIIDKYSIRKPRRYNKQQAELVSVPAEQAYLEVAGGV